MNLNALIEQLKDVLTGYWARIQDSSAFNTMRERFETLQPNAQKAIVIGGIVFVASIFLYIPYSYVSSASETMALFEEERAAIRDLLRASRLPDPNQFLLPQMSVGELEGRVQTTLGEQQLTNDQRGPVTPIDGSGLIPASLNQAGLSIELKALNLEQIVTIGSKLQDFGRSHNVKLLDMEVTASEKHPDYFDVIYKVFSFGVAMEKSDEEGAEPPGARLRGKQGTNRFKNMRKKKADNESDL